MRIHYFQHVPFETLGIIEEWAIQNGHSLSRTAFWQDAALPALDEYDALIVLGGPMGVHDTEKYSWLSTEKAHLRAAIDKGKPVLGICLGAQLIADVMDAEVRKNAHKEIGWFPITFTAGARKNLLLARLSDGLTVLHWHGDTFDIPDGAIRMAESEACANQGFIFKNHVVGLQFHLEMTKESVHAILEACKGELVADKYVQSYEQILSQTHLAAANKAMTRLLQHWLNPA